ncbi:hypothetical protein SAMN05518871_107165 [Psychrobacillus sp. OK028]|uniref:hypothetical protein n=1 Tax=Psychrobacillus sp. OK028 TaxID=1884359 RepID=UPI00088757CD|nr:hypothetical protein [Psychrobacillus sp. OK028]SDN76788.1 hypothetical protein SAMN05518871_107165 [Psychrobacillus sp. OK028]
MIYSVDRVQFDSDGNLIFFEFYNRKKDNVKFVEKKYKSLSLISHISLIGVIYDDQYKNGSNIIVRHKDETKNYKWNDYKEWFVLKNADNLSKSKSKTLGSATQNEGDPYVHDVLEKIHGIDFTLDDTGLGITKSALEQQATLGFDFDLFEDKTNTIIEFLNNETKEKMKNPIDNLQAHPMRYSWISESEQKDFAKRMNEINPRWQNPRKTDNRQKYISLWKATQKLKGKLYLVNYNLDKSENLSVIEIIDLDEHKGIISDISYKLTYVELITWLEMMNETPLEAIRYLKKFPNEVRSEEFWNNYYQNQDEYATPRRSHIGKNYK